MPRKSVIQPITARWRRARLSMKDTTKRPMNANQKVSPAASSMPDLLRGSTQKAITTATRKSDSNRQNKTYKRVLCESVNPVCLTTNAKVSDGSQPPMAFDFSSGLNGWLPFAAPFCWLEVAICVIPHIRLGAAQAHPKARLHNPGIA